MDVLFIVGMPRSGTKLLRDILNRHNDIAIFPVESHFLPHFHGRFGEYGDIMIRENFARFYAAIQETTFMRSLAQRGTAFSEDAWFEALPGSDFAAAMGALFSLFSAHTGSRIVGDKTPAYITETALLLELFPDAKFIHIVRDPRDYVLSLRKAWNQNFVRATQRWKDSIRLFHSVMESSGAEFMETRYEDLTSEPASCVDQICSYLDVRFDNEMLHLNEPSENIGDTKGARVVVSSNFGKWKRELRPREIRSIESIAGNMMEELGYSLQGRAGDDNARPLYLRLARLLDTWNRFRFVYRDEGNLGAALKRIGRTARFRVRNG